MGNTCCGYYIANPDEYIIQTGMCINDIKISKKCFKYPYQKVSKMRLEPENYELELETMSNEKLEFKIPCIFTIGPNDKNEELIKYTKFINGKSYEEIQQIIKGIAEGEMRLLTSKMTIEEIFNDRNSFKFNIIREIQKELNYFGLFIYNANLKELEDFPGSEYFIHIKQKAIAEARNTARIEVANANYTGEILVKEKEKDTRIKLSKIEYEAILYENIKNAEIAKSITDLEIKKSEYNRLKEIAKIESDKYLQIREIELQKQIESVNFDKETESIRSVILANANVESEASERRANARLFEQKNEAEGILTLLNAQSNGLNKLLDATNNPQIALQYLMMQSGTLERLAKHSADAIQGLNPTITHWTTGGDKPSPLTTIFQTIPPILGTIYEQFTPSSS